MEKILDGYWIFEEGKITYVEFGHRIEKVEVAYAWHIAEPLKFLFNHTLYNKIKRIKNED
ncbi:MAG: hypothetical protein MJZ34_05435 [Paludibacteraceae bacterium]|nr:hypothetical protein [Paludibacteraceae bacterium]